MALDRKKVSRTKGFHLGGGRGTLGDAFLWDVGVHSRKLSMIEFGRAVRYVCLLLFLCCVCAPFVLRSICVRSVND